MPLAARIIPLLLHSHGMLVKGIRFQSWRTAGHALQAARIHQARGVDELLLLDVAATPEASATDYAIVRDLSANCFMPITAGGGVRSLNDVKTLLRVGADKIAIGGAIHTHNELITQCAAAVGSQAIVAVIETSHGRTFVGGSEWVSLTPAQMAIDLQGKGAGEILLMSRDRDGTLRGYDLETLRTVASAVDIPVIVAGGAGTYEHMLEAIKAGASAVAAGAMFQWTDATPKGAAQYLHENNIEVRTQ